MSIESAIEQKIREAIARGEFDNLSGSGKPLDLDAYFNTPEDLRMVAHGHHPIEALAVPQFHCHL